MYCANCGTQLVQGLSYCNRCGSNLRERTESNTAAIGAFLTAITTLGVAGLAILFGGVLVLKRKAQLDPELIGVFMTFTFFLVGLIEFMLIRNLSKLMTAKESRTPSLPPVTNELRLPHASNLGEPVPSVTENTTRTLEYASRERGRN